MIQTAIIEQVLVPNVLETLRKELQAAIESGDKNVRDHTSTKTLPWNFVKPAYKRYFERAGNIAVRTGERILGNGTKLQMTFADLVYRHPGANASRHKDDDDITDRVFTAVVPLHTMPKGLGGRTIIEMDGRDISYDFIAGRMILYPSKLQHWVETPGEARYALLLWLKEVKK